MSVTVDVRKADMPICSIVTLGVSARACLSSPRVMTSRPPTSRALEVAVDQLERRLRDALSQDVEARDDAR